MGFLIILLVAGLIVGGICAAVASSKGRNAFGWFFLGLSLTFLLNIFGIIPIILICVLPNLKEKREKEMHILRQQRRLKEQLKQEKLKGESFREHTSARLGEHDQAIGIDTSMNSPLMLDSDTSTPPPLKRKSDVQDNIWYYEFDEKEVGPVSKKLILNLIQNNTIGSTTLLWMSDFEDWTPAGEVNDFKNHLMR